ncbi:hypothetical protein FOZ60_007437 [Perkinsus olseni]|uniref:Uncharacterized protein n=2 Tax=Perkinsus olseni TaxID=32597 RepID=A0A7J6PPA5_PEROL|nr:hypothetical protein FOZ60_007437 [Perkinsus olseni]
MTFNEFRDCSDEKEQSQLKPQETELMVLRRCSTHVVGKLDNGAHAEMWFGFDVVDTDKGRGKLTDMTDFIRPRLSPYSTVHIIVNREMMASTEWNPKTKKLDFDKKTFLRNKWHTCKWKTEVAARHQEDIWEVIPVATFQLTLDMIDSTLGLEISMLTAEVYYKSFTPQFDMSRFRKMVAASKKFPRTSTRRPSKSDLEYLCIEQIMAFGKSAASFLQQGPPSSPEESVFPIFNWVANKSVVYPKVSDKRWTKEVNGYIQIDIA